MTDPLTELRELTRAATHKARLFDEMAQGVLSEFSDIIRAEWNTSTPGGGLPGCIEGALRERKRLLAERRALLDVAAAARTALDAHDSARTPTSIGRGEWEEIMLDLRAALARLDGEPR